MPFARLLMRAGPIPLARNSKGLSEAPAVADHADGDALDRERVAAQIQFDRLELGVLRLEAHGMAAPAQPLYRHFVAQASNDDLPASRFGGAMHRQPIA